MTTTEATPPPAVPTATLRHEDDLPFVDVGDGTHLQLLKVDVEAGLWVLRTRFEPGVTIATHKHTGEVHAFTLAGRWLYLEYPDDVNTAGSYLFEPAGSIHTLHVPDDVEGLTDVFFTIQGANLNLDAAGNVTTVVDAGLMREIYLALCEAAGVPDPPLIGA